MLRPRLASRGRHSNLRVKAQRIALLLCACRSSCLLSVAFWDRFFVVALLYVLYTQLQRGHSRKMRKFTHKSVLTDSPARAFASSRSSAQFAPHIPSNPSIASMLPRVSCLLPRVLLCSLRPRLCPQRRGKLYTVRPPNTKPTTTTDNNSAKCPSVPSITAAKKLAASGQRRSWRCE